MSDVFLDGFARVINHSAEAGEVRIEAFDDEGESYGSVVLSVGARATASITSNDLETGNTAMGLSGTLRPGQGAWRLQLSSELEIEVLAYVATHDGFLTPMHDTVPNEGRKHHVAIFNPGSDAHVSSLRLVNLGREAAEVLIVGVDDDGASPGGEVTTTIPAGASRTITASALESGGDGLEGSLGDGAGMWRLVVESEQPIIAMNLLSTPTGHISNLSTVPANETGGVHLVPLLPAVSDAKGRQGFVRMINRSDVAGEVKIKAFDDTGWGFKAVMLPVDANEAVQLSSDDLEFGNPGVGLRVGTGAGQGAWRLELTSGLDIRVLSYVRAADGVVAAMHDMAPLRDGRYRVATFNPGSNADQQSLLRLVNPDEAAAVVTVTGTDDHGESPGNEVRVMVPSGGSKTLTVQDLEHGGDGMTGALGDGAGWWQLTVESTHPIIVMSLLSDATGHLANLSTVPGPSAAIESRSQPGLVVDSPSVSDSSPAAGTQFTLSATVRNDGGGTSAATTLRYYRSTDATITTTDTGVGTDAVAELAASGNSGESTALTAPSEPGSYYYGACVDAVADEYDATNNCSSSVQVTISSQVGATRTQGQPDLVVVSPSVSDSSPAAGAQVTLSATVRNDGAGTSAATTLRYYRSINTTISGFNTEVGKVSVAELAASGSLGDSVGLSASSTPGTHYYGACVDAVAEESKTTNNCSTAVRVDVQEPPSQVHPDLVVTSPSVSDSSPAAGTQFTLSATVRNYGGAASAATTLRYYRSTDATITTTDTGVGADAVAELAASGNSNESTALTAPSLPGTYYYGACADAVAEESDTTDNCSSSVQVTISAQVDPPETQGHPNLVVTSPSVSDSSPAAGTQFTLSATVRNHGGAASAATTLRYYRSTDATITTSDTAEGTDSVAELAASGSAGDSVALTVPSTAGTYYYGACVDAVADESDTTFNCSTSVQVNVLELQSQPEGGPDLEVGSPTVSGSSPVEGGSFTLSATVSNAGDGESAATTLRYYRSADATISRGDAQFGTDPVGALAASGTSAEAISLTAPSTAGTYYYGACVDSVADESDTTDNCSESVTVEVGEPTTTTAPDLQVGSPTVSDSSPVEGGSFTLSATVSNVGDGESAAATLRYYRSADATISSADAQVGMDAVGALAASGTSAESISLTAPSTAGTYYYGACVDSVTDESDTTDNCSGSVTVEVEEPAATPSPDLEVGSPSVTDSNPAGGGTFTLSATVRNAGGAASPATTLRYYRFTDATISTADTQEGNQTVASLIASVSYIGSVDMTAPSTPGTYYYGACVDAVTGESDTTNNCSTSVQVTVPKPQPQEQSAPDLTIDGIIVFTSPGPFGIASFSLTTAVRNAGDGDAAATTLRYYRSTDATISSSDTQVGTATVAALAATETSNKLVDLTLPSSPGTYYYGACVDAVTGESDTTNNCSGSVRFTVPE